MANVTVEFGKTYVTAGGQIVQIVEKGFGFYEFTGSNGVRYDENGEHHMIRKDRNTIVREYGSDIFDLFGAPTPIVRPVVVTRTVPVAVPVPVERDATETLVRAGASLALGLFRAWKR